MRYVILDDGHGGKDPGSVSMDKRYQEKNIVRLINNHLEALLIKDGGFVVNRPFKNDTFTGVNARASKYRELSTIIYRSTGQKPIMVSMHTNAFSDPNSKGFETWSHKVSNEGARLSKCIYNEVIKNNSLYTAQRGVKYQNWGVFNGGPNYYGVLIESAFITNSQDLNILLNKQEEFAKAVYNGILKYYNKSVNIPADNKKEKEQKKQQLTKAKISYKNKDHILNSILYKDENYIKLKDFCNLIDQKLTYNAKENKIELYDYGVKIIKDNETFILDGDLKHNKNIVLLTDILDLVGVKYKWDDELKAVRLL